jgi:hypothetical protein
MIRNVLYGPNLTPFVEYIVHRMRIGYKSEFPKFESSLPSSRRLIISFFRESIISGILNQNILLQLPFSEFTGIAKWLG